ncbi:hypothetical protein ACHAXR_006516 [Thalassiosira sp. AJA248-18]
MTVIIEATDTVGVDTKERTSPKSLPAVDTLFVWDFDWTIVNCNSDEYVPSKFLGDAATSRRLSQLVHTLGSNKWHECVSSLINSCITESGCSKQDICEAAASMPYLVDVKGSLEDVANDTRCGQMIISDGNDEFIHAYLKKNGIEPCFSHVETNFAKWYNEKEFNVVYQSSKYGGHTCGTCPPNLCKSQVLLDLLSRVDYYFPNGNTESAKKRPRIVYIGDGSNDACPALHVLEEGDVLLAREGRKISNPNSKTGPQSDEEIADDTMTGSFPILSTLKKAEDRGLVPKCLVSSWSSGKELRSLIRNALDEN